MSMEALFKLIEKYSQRDIITGDELLFEDLGLTLGTVIAILQEIEVFLNITLIFADIKKRTPNGLLEYINNVK